MDGYSFIHTVGVDRAVFFFSQNSSTVGGIKFYSLSSSSSRTLCHPPVKYSALRFLCGSMYLQASATEMHFDWIQSISPTVCGMKRHIFCICLICFPFWSLTEGDQRSPQRSSWFCCHSLEDVNWTVFHLSPAAPPPSLPPRPQAWVDHTSDPTCAPSPYKPNSRSCPFTAPTHTCYLVYVWLQASLAYRVMDSCNPFTSAYLHTVAFSPSGNINHRAYSPAN